MTDVVIVEAVRTPIGRRNGGLSTIHSADLLGAVLREADRAQRASTPAEVGQVVGGCVSQVGQQSFNVTRTAWLTAGLPDDARRPRPSTRQCGSSQQATNLAASLVASGVVDVAVACGVENLSQVPMGSGTAKAINVGRAIPKSYFGQYEFTTQFEGAERIADKWGITRADADEFGLRVPAAGGRGLGRGPLRHARSCRSTRPTSTRTASRPAPPTASSATRACGRPPSRGWPTSSRSPAKTASTPPARSSQISDGAAAVLMMTREKADALGLTPRARIVDTVPGRRRPGAHAHRADRRHPAPARAQPDIGHGRHRHSSRSTRRSPRWCWPGSASCHRHGQGQPQRRRHRPRPSRSAAPAPSSSPRPSTSWSAPTVSGAGHHVLRRRPRHRHPHRADRLAGRARPPRATAARPPTTWAPPGRPLPSRT